MAPCCNRGFSFSVSKNTIYSIKNQYRKHTDNPYVECD
ncbi:Hypothetical protein ETEE_p1067 (plasmid) [Edwardsiella anguillarum ET080813]|uniref:Transposase n=1 Tax=Edwardsiella anguillarum ET080813 TaxID=667120 RepID=A0A076LVW8_9GAMM|nr:Hypothetical protein ETEE_p1067 [Edwardsiella anguillarum ET080813]